MFYMKNATSAANSIRVAVGAETGLGVAWAEGDHEDNSNTTSTHDTEGGHIDFAPVDEIQIELPRFLRQSFGHASYERILYGGGLVSL